MALTDLGTGVDGSECHLVRVKEENFWHIIAHYYGIVTLEGVRVTACNIFINIPHCFCPCCWLHISICQLDSKSKPSIFILKAYPSFFIILLLGLESFCDCDSCLIISFSVKCSNLPRIKHPSP